jgi:hypothetical protein
LGRSSPSSRTYRWEPKEIARVSGFPGKRVKGTKVSRKRIPDRHEERRGRRRTAGETGNRLAGRWDKDGGGYQSLDGKIRNS